jgi:hypothetical protein
MMGTSSLQPEPPFNRTKLCRVAFVEAVVPTACRQALDTKGSQGRPDGAERWRVGIVYKLKKTLTTSSPPLLKRPSEDKEEARAGSVKLDLARLLVGFVAAVSPPPRATLDDGDIVATTALPA